MIPDVWSWAAVHAQLFHTRGSASDEHCLGCGGTGHSWALQPPFDNPHYLIDPKNGRQYSLDLDDYGPMCNSCHLSMDYQYHPKWQESNRRNGTSQASRKRRCLECGMISAPAPLGWHQKRKQHSGWEEIL